MGIQAHSGSIPEARGLPPGGDHAAVFALSRPPLTAAPRPARYRCATPSAYIGLRVLEGCACRRNPGCGMEPLRRSRGTFAGSIMISFRGFVKVSARPGGPSHRFPLRIRRSVTVASLHTSRHTSPRLADVCVGQVDYVLRFASSVTYQASTFGVRRHDAALGPAARGGHGARRRRLPVAPCHCQAKRRRAAALHT